MKQVFIAGDEPPPSGKFLFSKRLSQHLKELAEHSQAIARQFIPSREEEKKGKITVADPLLEDEHTAVRGLVHKYPNRALILLTMNCAAYCRFCTRRRSVSDIQKGVISDYDLDQMVNYLKKNPKIKELILSGGDPLTTPQILEKALRKFTKLPQIKIIRVGTRLPVSDPKMVNRKVLSALSVVKNQPLYLMLHFEHPDEITPATIKAVKKLKQVSSMMFSQSVFLKGVNDDVHVLSELFSKLVEIGVKPYYIYRCDYVEGAEHFIVDFNKEIEIMSKLRARLSGLAFPSYVIDIAGGEGKIPVPLDFWKFDRNRYQDFTGKKIARPKKAALCSRAAF